MKPFGAVDELVDFAITARGEFGFIAEFSDGWITLGRLLRVRRVYAVIREGLIIETVKTERSTVLAL